MTVETPADDGGILSIDAAIALLDAPEKEREEAPALDTNEGRTEHEEVAPDTSEADGAETQTESEDGADEGEHAEDDKSELPAIEAPKFWDAKQKAMFGELPREVQEIIAAKESERTSYASRQAQEAAERRKQADAEAQRYSQLAAGLDPLLAQGRNVFKQRWDNVDWNKVIDEYGAENALKLQNQFRQEQAHLSQLEQAKAQADEAALQQFVQAESVKLAQLVPDLVDPKQGKARKDALTKFLLDLDVKPHQIVRLTAAEAALAYDAMRWRDGQATAKKLAKKPAPPPPQKTNPTKPGSSQRAASSNDQRIAALSKKRSLSIDEAVELADLKASRK